MATTILGVSLNYTAKGPVDIEQLNAGIVRHIQVTPCEGGASGNTQATLVNNMVIVEMTLAVDHDENSTYEPGSSSLVRSVDTYIQQVFGLEALVGYRK